MIPGETGIIVPEISAPALAGVVGKYLANISEINRLSRNGIRFVKNNFDWTKTAREVVKLCDTISDLK